MGDLVSEMLAGKALEEQAKRIGLQRQVEKLSDSNQKLRAILKEHPDYKWHVANPHLGGGNTCWWCKNWGTICDFMGEGT
jgi:hypothetical protein